MSNKEKKEEIWLSPMKKAPTNLSPRASPCRSRLVGKEIEAPTPPENPKNNVTTQKRHQNFDYTTIVDRHRTVSWDNDSHPTGVVKSVYGIQSFH